MILELKKDEFTNILPLVNSLKNSVPLIFSVIEQKQNGKIFVDSVSNPSVTLVYHDVGILNLIGNSKNDNFNKELHKLIYEKIEHKQKYFALGVHSNGFEGKIEKLIGKSVEKEIRTCFNLSNLKVENDLRYTYNKFQLKSIDIELMERVNNELDFCKEYWNSSEDFIKYGLGYCFLEKDKIISTCYSCTVGDNYIELDLETLKEFEGMGLATILTNRFINNCIKRGMKPVWVCNKDNITSYKLAKKLGFEEVSNYVQYWWLLNK